MGVSARAPTGAVPPVPVPAPDDPVGGEGRGAPPVGPVDGAPVSQFGGPVAVGGSVDCPVPGLGGEGVAMGSLGGSGVSAVVAAVVGADPVTESSPGGVVGTCGSPVA